MSASSAKKAARAGRRGLGGVGVVAVDHEVVVGVDVAQHLAHDVALALAALHLDRGPVGARDVAGAVGGVVVVHVDGRLGQHAPEVVDHLGDGHRFVVAGYDDGHAFAGGRSGIVLRIHRIHEASFRSELLKIESATSLSDLVEELPF